MGRHCGADLEPLVLLRVFRQPEYQASRGTSRPRRKIRPIRSRNLHFPLKAWMTTGQTFTLIDVREDNEWQEGMPPRPSTFLAGQYPEKFGTVVPDRPPVLCSTAWVERGRAAGRGKPSEKGLHKRVFSDRRVFKNINSRGCQCEMRHAAVRQESRRTDFGEAMKEDKASLVDEPGVHHALL